MKILVVDDDKFNLMIAKDSLEDQVEHSGILLCRNPLEVMDLLATEEISPFGYCHAAPGRDKLAETDS